MGYGAGGDQASRSGWARACTQSSHLKPAKQTQKTNPIRALQQPKKKKTYPRPNHFQKQKKKPTSPPPPPIPTHLREDDDARAGAGLLGLRRQAQRDGRDVRPPALRGGEGWCGVVEFDSDGCVWV